MQYIPNTLLKAIYTDLTDCKSLMDHENVKAHTRELLQRNISTTLDDLRPYVHQGE